MENVQADQTAGQVTIFHGVTQWVKRCFLSRGSKTASKSTRWSRTHGASAPVVKVDIVSCPIANPIAQIIPLPHGMPVFRGFHISLR